MILDEATSALDGQSERVVQKALEGLQSAKSVSASGGRDSSFLSDELITITIAHRLSTVRNCDRIFVLSQGEMKEFGTHEELLGKPDGIYKALVQASTGKAAAN